MRYRVKGSIMTNNRMDATARHWAFKKSTGYLALFIQGNPARAALKLGNPALHDARLRYAKAELTARAERGVPCPT